ncbi:MAG: hypothetical protein ACI9XO_000281 [Paraglaciecola sp.]|jgi:hypothetical protein
MPTPSNAQSEAQSIELLKQILLREDRSEVEQLKEILNNPDQLSERISPIIEKHLVHMKQNFPVEYNTTIEKIITKKLENSQEELLNTISPVMGQMIRKYVQYQFQLLKEILDAQLDATFNQGIIGKVRGLFGGKAQQVSSETIIANLDRPLIEEIYVIEHYSGILIGSASRLETIDIDVIAGMLTAIKSFVEDAFKRGKEELEMIQYETFTILLENFHSYYIAAAVSGSMSMKERVDLENSLAKFAEKELKVNMQKKDGSANLIIKQKLEKYFFEPQKKALETGTSKD